MANEFDRIFKENIESIFMPIVERRLGVEIVESKPLPTKLTGTFEREVDHLFDVRTKGGKRFLLHFEFQTHNDQKMLRRIVLYHGHLFFKYGLPIRHFVIYLGTKPMQMRAELRREEVFTGFSTLALQGQRVEEALASKVPEEVILGILNDFGSMESLEVIRKIIERLRVTSPGENELRRYLKQLGILSRIRKLDGIIEKELEDMPLNIDWKLEEDAFYKSGLARGVEEGRAEGKRQTLLGLYHQGILTLAYVAEELGSTEEEVLQFVQEMKDSNR